jgi:thiopurine S-methyltransferase
MHSLLNSKGKLVGVMFNDPMNADHPPFGGTAEEYKKYFENLFKINIYKACYNSIKPRAGKELFINLEKI